MHDVVPYGITRKGRERMPPDTAQAAMGPGQTQHNRKTDDAHFLPQGITIAVLLVASLALALAVCTKIGVVVPANAASSIQAAGNQLIRSLANPEFAVTVLGWWVFVFVVMLLARRAKTKFYLVLIPLAIFFGFTMVFGYSLDSTGNINLILGSQVQVVKTIIAMIGWGALFYLVGTVVFDFLEQRMDAGTFRIPRRPSEGTTRKGGVRKFFHALGRFVFDWNSFVIPFLLLLLAWMPSIIGYAPALFLGDTPVQLSMWYGKENCVSNYVELLYPDVTITTHHPVLHTMMLGACVQYGLEQMGSAMEGMYLYIHIQLAFTLTCFAYGFTLMKKLRVAYWLRLICLVLFALVPWYSEYAMLVSKDVPFADALLVFCLQLIYLARKQGNPFDWTVLALSAFMVTLMRNGGELFAYAGLAVLTILLYSHRDKGGRYKVAFALVAAVAIVASSFAYYTFSVMHVTPGNRIEALSVPVQQTARYVKEFPDDVTPQERKAIDDVLVYEGLETRYSALESDPVKNYAADHRGDASDEAWSKYFTAWASMGSRHPLCYVVATMNGYYGYFYVSQLDLFHYTYEHSQLNARAIFNDTGLRIHMEYAQESKDMAQFRESYLESFEQIPVLNLLMRPAIWCWALLIFTALSLRRRWKPAYPAIVTLWFFMLVFLIGPCNGATYTRYAYPLAVVLPYAFSMLLADAGARKPKPSKQPSQEQVAKGQDEALEAELSQEIEEETAGE